MKKIFYSFTFLLISISAFAQIPPGAVGYYMLDGHPYDSSGLNNHGNYIGTVTPSYDRWGNPGGASYFDGISGHIDMGVDPDFQLTDSISISAWINPIMSNDWKGIASKWLREQNRGIELKGKTVAIIGYGKMGSSFAEKLRGFKVKILAYDKYKTGFGNEFVSETTMDEIFSEADIVSLHIPLTEETHHLARQDFFSNFKKPFYLLNTSRGKVVDTTALADAIQKGKISGACLDVLEYEAQSFQRLFEDDSVPVPAALQHLLNCDKVIFTPHIAGWTFESDEKIGSLLADKVLELFS